MGQRTVLYKIKKKLKILIPTVVIENIIYVRQEYCLGAEFVLKRKTRGYCIVGRYIRCFVAVGIRGI